MIVSLLFPALCRTSSLRFADGLAAIVFSLSVGMGAHVAIAQQAAPLPPDRGAAPRPPAKAPAAAKPVERCDSTPAVSAAELVKQANAYFNSFPYLNADFVQLNADGRRFKGQLFVSRPGKLRFDYDAPSPLEIVSDGSTVVLRNRKLATQDVYGIGQTPLKFLLKDRLDLATDTKLLSASRECDTVSITIEDKSTIAGTSRIRLVLAGEPLGLKQWTISDPNGTDTTVQLSKLDTTRRPDPKLFTIDTTRVLDPK